MTQLIDINKVTSSYNGKVGCMCGCNGTYSMPSSVVVTEHNSHRRVSDRSVKIAVNKLNKAIQAGQEVDITEQYVYMDDGYRCTAVYFD